MFSSVADFFLFLLFTTSPEGWPAWGLVSRVWSR